MKVVIVSPSISRVGGGVSEALRLAAMALSKTDGVSVEIVTCRDEHFHEDVSYFPNVKITAYKYFGPSNFKLSPGLLFDLLFRPADIIHVHGVWMFHCLAVLLRWYFSRTPYVVTPHGMLEPWIISRGSGVKRIVSALFHDRFLRNASDFHVLTAKEREDVNASVQAKATTIVPNFVPLLEDPVEKLLPQWWRSSFNDRTVFLFLGRIHEKKGCVELCEAWDTLCSHNLDFARRSVLVICGWTDGVKNFPDRVHALDEKYGNAVYAGPQYGAQKSATLFSSSFFVLPSKSEGLPLAVLEAWAAGVPALLTDECNLPLGFEYRAALRIGTASNEILVGLEVASSMTALAIQDMASASRTLITECFSEAAVQSALLASYNSVLSKC